MNNDLQNPTEREQVFFEVGYKRGTEKVRSVLNLMALVFGVFMFIIGLLLGSKCHAQSPLIDVRPENKDVLDRHQKSLREQAYLNELHYDTIPCHLLYRTQAGQVGIVKGWEVRQSIKHITYLLYNRRRFPKGTEVWKLDQPIKIH